MTTMTKHKVRTRRIRHAAALKEEESLAAYIASSYFTMDALDALTKGARKAIKRQSENNPDNQASVSNHWRRKWSG